MVDEQSLHVRSVLSNRVRPVLGCFALAKSHVVGDHHAALPDQSGNELSIEKAPGRLAMNAHDRVVLALVDVVPKKPVSLIEVGSKGPHTIKGLLRLDQLIPPRLVRDGCTGSMSIEACIIIG